MHVHAYVHPAVTRSASVVAGHRWSVVIGQCPSFTDRQLRSLATVEHLVWVYIASILAACLLIAGCVLAAVQWHEKDVALRVAIAKHEERCETIMCFRSLACNHVDGVPFWLGLLPPPRRGTLLVC